MNIHKVYRYNSENGPAYFEKRARHWEMYWYSYQKGHNNGKCTSTVTITGLQWEMYQYSLKKWVQRGKFADPTPSSPPGSETPPPPCVKWNTLCMKIWIKASRCEVGGRNIYPAKPTSTHSYTSSHGVKAYPWILSKYLSVRACLVRLSPGITVRMLIVYIF
jgi:hypothetical protein